MVRAARGRCNLPDGAVAHAHPPQGGEDSRWYLHSFASGQSVYSFRGHHGKVHCLRFSPNGTQVASGCVSRAGGEGADSPLSAPTPPLPDARPPHPLVRSAAYVASSRVCARVACRLRPSADDSTVRLWQLPQEVIDAETESAFG